jgi:D-glycero-alpha-D-manno-heptose-7-phosphate kinase
MMRREQIVPPAAAFADLSARLHTVYLGAPHASSAMHDQVIARLDQDECDAELDALRTAAEASIDALVAGDVDAFGRALTSAHSGIEMLHDGLVGDDARSLIELAAAHGARGWKVNGAGGDGGSMVVLGPADPEADAALVAAIEGHGRWQVLVAALDAPGVTTHVAVADTFEHDETLGLAALVVPDDVDRSGRPD